MMYKPVTEWTVPEKLFISQEFSKAVQEIDRLRLILGIAGINPDAKPHEPDGD